MRLSEGNALRNDQQLTPILFWVDGCGDAHVMPLDISVADTSFSKAHLRRGAALTLLHRVSSKQPPTRKQQQEK
jgi:hypothetical protein